MSVLCNQNDKFIEQWQMDTARQVRTIYKQAVIIHQVVLPHLPISFKVKHFNFKLDELFIYLLNAFNCSTVGQT